jgi:hypothetical protein
MSGSRLSFSNFLVAEFGVDVGYSKITSLNNPYYTMLKEKSVLSKHPREFNAKIHISSISQAIGKSKVSTH